MTDTINGKMAENNNTVDISVIVPIYNVEEEFLRPCLDSIANQTKDNIEVIMVDDGSTDNSGIVADEYAQRYHHFTCHHIENGGLGHARNYGITFATGKYIFFIDSDDEITTTALEKMYIAAEKDGSDMAICNVERYNSSKGWSSTIHSRAFRNLESVTHITKNHDLLYDSTSWNKLIRRDFWERYHFAFPENVLYEDIPTTIPVHYLANQVSVVRSIGYKWRVRDMASKSITQNTSDLVNLQDRIKILKMLDAFFEENVSDSSLHLDKQIKALRFDLMIFVNVSTNIDREVAEEMMALIKDYIRSSISDEALHSLNMIEQHLYQCLLNDDYENFILSAQFRKNELANSPLIEENGRLNVKLPTDIFGVEYSDLTNDAVHYTPRVYINEISSSGSVITLLSQLYFWRINIAKPEQLDIKAFLFNEFTRKEIPLEVTPYDNNLLTKIKGTAFNQITGEKSEYNYDGTGFEVKIDLSAINPKDIKEGTLIVLQYKNRFNEGYTALRNMNAFTTKRARGLSVISGNAVGRLDVATGGMLNFYAEKADCFLDKYEFKNKQLCFTINKDMRIIAKNNNDENDIIEFTKDSDFNYSILTDKLISDTDYSIIAIDENGEETKLVRDNKGVNLKDLKNDCAFIIRSNKTHNVSIKKLDSTSFLKKFKKKGNTISFETVSAGNLNAKQFSQSRIIVNDNIVGKEVTLAKSHCEVKDGRAYCKFSIDFDSPKVQKNLYQSYRDLLIEYINSDGETVTHNLYSKKSIEALAKYETLSITCYRSSEVVIRLKIEQLWPEQEASNSKRKALMFENYPKYREEPIKDNLILFESLWGSKYNCNPQAIYEYIDKNYPQYECVWSLKDARTPINGRAKRVRRGSQEYYKILATAKYLINNVNFEENYVKRDGQIEVQTMHGTPLKTFGLDVEDEMNSQEKRDRFIRKTSRWNYLVVQGKFMESMAYQCFRYEKDILTTGYPRTDILYKDRDLDKIKKQLGIPLDKKVILYTPTWRIKKTFDMQLDLEKMRKELSDEYVILIRIHYLCAEDYNVTPDNEFIFDLTRYTDVQALYKISDMLITDYSSVMFDYALLNKPMLFYAYDLNTYSEATRGVYFDIREEAPGPILYTTEEVINAIVNIDEEMKKVEKRYVDFKNKYLTYENGNSAKMVVDKVIKPSRFDTLMCKAKNILNI